MTTTVATPAEVSPATQPVQGEDVARAALPGVSPYGDRDQKPNPNPVRVNYDAARWGRPAGIGQDEWFNMSHAAKRAAIAAANGRTAVANTVAPVEVDSHAVDWEAQPEWKRIAAEAAGSEDEQERLAKIKRYADEYQDKFTLNPLESAPDEAEPEQTDVVEDVVEAKPEPVKEPEIKADEPAATTTEKPSDFAGQQEDFLTAYAEKYPGGRVDAVNLSDEPTIVMKTARTTAQPVAETPQAPERPQGKVYKVEQYGSIRRERITLKDVSLWLTMQEDKRRGGPAVSSQVAQQDALKAEARSRGVFGLADGETVPAGPDARHRHLARVAAAVAVGSSVVIGTGLVLWNKLSSLTPVLEELTNFAYRR